MTAPSVAADALARVDDGIAQPGDRELIDVFEKHVYWGAFVWPEPLCVHGNTSDCNSCFLDHDDMVHRSVDL